MRLLAFILILSGCASEPRTAGIESRSLILAPDLAEHEQAWRNEFNETYGYQGFLLIFAHGVKRDDDWYFLIGNRDSQVVGGRVMALAKFARWRLPDNAPIALIICNPEGFVCDVPNVYFADRYVWENPGDDVRKWNGSFRSFAGDAGDFKRVR